MTYVADVKHNQETLCKNRDNDQTVSELTLQMWSDHTWLFFSYYLKSGLNLNKLHPFLLPKWQNILILFAEFNNLTFVPI